jgi:two-component system sensor histidine kinase KdpD
VLGTSSLSAHRRQRGYLLSALAIPGLTLALVPFRDSLALATTMPAFLLLTVVIALLGGRGPAIVAALTGSVAINIFFVPPYHHWSIAEPENVVSVLTFVLVAILVSWAVDLAARRTQQAAEAAARADTNAAAAHLRTAILAAVGHDLRTPLAVAKAGVSGLRSTAVDLTAEDRHALLIRADQALDRLAGLMEDLLDLSRLQTGALTLRRQPVSVDDVMARALDDIGVEPRGVILDVDENLPPVLADPVLLERVLANLIINAQRFSPAGVPPTVIARPAGGRIQIQVVDHGPGIPAEDSERVFAPFQRLGDTDAGTGLGLGLALARGLTEAMGGTLAPRDTRPVGLTMVLDLEAAVEDSES